MGSNTWFTIISAHPLKCQIYSHQPFSGLVQVDDFMFNEEAWEPIMRIRITLSFTNSLPQGFMNNSKGKTN